MNFKAVEIKPERKYEHFIEHTLAKHDNISTFFKLCQVLLPVLF